jgi:hypothetical protein
MKKVAVIIVLIFAVGLLMSACTNKACPAYGQVETEQLENLG